jgi:hypothetical protein
MSSRRIANRLVLEADALGKLAQRVKPDGINNAAG